MGFKKNLLYLTRREGVGARNSQNYAYVIYGRPISSYLDIFLFSSPQYFSYRSVKWNLHSNPFSLLKPHKTFLCLAYVKSHLSYFTAKVLEKHPMGINSFHTRKIWINKEPLRQLWRHGMALTVPIGWKDYIWLACLTNTIHIQTFISIFIPDFFFK